MAVAVSFILGGTVGLIPLLLGLILKQPQLGVVAFLFCTFLGFLTGLVGPVVAAAGFIVGILASWHRAKPRSETQGS